MRTLIIDNYDSFTWNLVQYIAETNGEEPLVVRNDSHDWVDLVASERFDNIVISPGPGTVERDADFGISRVAIASSEVPLLGVCLGHQGIGHAFGAQIIHAPEPVHGRSSLVWHNNDPLFVKIPSPWRVVRYHSLIVEAPLPEHLIQTAWTEEGLVMGLRHVHRPLWGVQFHPESILSEHGMQLMRNFRDITHSRRRRSTIAYASQPSPAVQSAHPVSPPREVRVHQVSTALSAEDLFTGLCGDSPRAFWLDSSLVEPGLSRFSFIGEPHDELVYRLDPEALEEGEQFLKRLEQDLQREVTGAGDLPFPFHGGWIGYFGYECKALFGARVARANSYPDAVWFCVERFVAIDHAAEKIYLVCLVEPGHDAEAAIWFEQVASSIERLAPVAEPQGPEAAGTLKIKCDQTRSDYIKSIAACHVAIRDGESYEVCLTNKMSVRGDVHGLTLYRILRRINPAPFAAYLRCSDLEIISASPERFLRVSTDGTIESKPIKGTCQRDPDPAADAELAEALRCSEKNRAENLMIVDLLRNDLNQVAETSSVDVPELMYIESYATLHQLVSTVTAKLRSGYSLIDLVRATFPGGSITGAPKLRTMEIIDKLERSARGVYCGSIGYLGYGGVADLSIAIRTIVRADGELSFGAGGAITHLSDANEEYDETLLKARALIEALCRYWFGDGDGSRYEFMASSLSSQNGQHVAWLEGGASCFVG
jgi:para-aminobenzoate synthetase